MVKIAKGAWVIDVRPYNLHIFVFTESYRAVRQLQNEGCSASELDNANAISCCINNEMGRYLWAYMPDGIEDRTVVHEAVHLAGMVFRMIGARYDAENDETFAYLVDNIYQQLHVAMSKPKHNGKPRMID